MGIFISPAGVAMKAQSGGLTILIWTAAGLVSLLGNPMYHIVSHITQSSGDVLYEPV